jgi:hypothetical protein
LIDPQGVERIARFIAKRLGLPHAFRVYIKNTTRGWGGMSSKGWYITIPHFLLHTRNKAYAVYYIAHEVTHLKSVNHGPRFKREERRALRIFGMGIKYKGNYPKVLYTLKTGEQLFFNNHHVSVAQTRKDHEMRSLLVSETFKTPSILYPVAYGEEKDG